MLDKISYISATEEILPTFKLTKFLLPFLTPLTQNEYTVTDSFHFAEEICKQDPNLYMTSLDVDSIFTNIPLDETIDICIDSLYKDDENTSKILKDVFRNLLNVATKEAFSNSFFLINFLNSINKLMVWLWGLYYVQL